MVKSLSAAIAVVVIALAPATARAQTQFPSAPPAQTEAQSGGRGDGLLVGTLPYLGVIGGGDAHIFKNVGVGGEGGLILGVGYLAPYAIAHMPVRGTNIVPFVSAGYIMLRDLDQGEGYFGPNFGGGVEIWFHPNKTAFRFEFSAGAPARHGYAQGLVLMRIGVSFR